MWINTAPTNAANTSKKMMPDTTTSAENAHSTAAYRRATESLTSATTATAFGTIKNERIRSCNLQPKKNLQAQHGMWTAGPDRRPRFRFMFQPDNAQICSSRTIIDAMEQLSAMISADRPKSTDSRR